MQISLSELKTHPGKYIELLNQQDVIITKNGKRVAKLTPFKPDKKAAAKALLGALPNDLDYDALRKERILK